LEPKGIDCVIKKKHDLRSLWFCWGAKERKRSKGGEQEKQPDR